MNKDCFTKDIDGKVRVIQAIKDSYDDLRIELEEMEQSTARDQSLLRLHESQMWFENCIRA